MPTPLPSTYLMNNIPRGTTVQALLLSLADNWKAHTSAETNYPLLLQLLEREPILQNSQLDDSLSVATLQFKLAHTPKWFQALERDPRGFPKATVLGTLWRGVDLTAVDGDGHNAFCAAVMSGDVLLAETLAEFPQTDVNMQDSDGRTALHWACVNRHLEMTEFLLTIPGLNSGLRNADGLTAFVVSCEGVSSGTTDTTADQPEALSTLFHRSILAMDRADPDGALLRLLTITSDPDEGDVFPGEALFRPVLARNLPLVNALMETGVDVTAINEDGETALHNPAKAGYLEILRAHLENPSRGSWFDLKAKAKDGRTPLDLATERGHGETVEDLLRYGARPATDDGSRVPPFNRAVKQEQMAVDEMLESVATGVDDIPSVQVDAERSLTPPQALPLPSDDPHFDTALYQAAQAGLLDAIVALLNEVANIDERGPRAQTALYGAIEGGHYNAVWMLLNLGAAVNAVDRNGETPLHRAASHGNPEILTLLLTQGASVVAIDNYQRTPLHMATEDRHLAVATLLLNH